MRIPRHIGIIPDGNRRWAKGAGLQKQDGYAHGLAPGLQLLQLARQAGVEELTYYGFTTDNCKRPPEQVRAFSAACVEAVRRIASEPVFLLVVGDSDAPAFPGSCWPTPAAPRWAAAASGSTFSSNYGWEWDLAGLHAPGGRRREICGQLRSAEISRVDLVIRWGGMRRLSGFLPVQSVYADFYGRRPAVAGFHPAGLLLCSAVVSKAGCDAGWLSRAVFALFLFPPKSLFLLPSAAGALCPRPFFARGLSAVPRGARGCVLPFVPAEKKFFARRKIGVLFRAALCYTGV